MRSVFFDFRALAWTTLVFVRGHLSTKFSKLLARSGERAAGPSLSLQVRGMEGHAVPLSVGAAPQPDQVPKRKLNRGVGEKFLGQ